MTIRDRIRYETRLALQRDRDGTMTRVSSAALVSIALIQLGYFAEAMWFFLAISLAELGFFGLMRALPDDTAEPSWRLCWLTVAVTMVRAPIYFVPCIILADNPAYPVIMLSVLWAGGGMAYITITRSMFPFYFFAASGPAALMVLASVTLGYQAHSSDAPVWMLWMVIGGALLYLFNSFKTLTHSSETRRQLEKARREAETRLVQLELAARCDPLTGLLNRKAFEGELATQLSSGDGASVVALIDLNGFKPINDSYGHEAGDQVLREVASRLVAAAPGGAAVARLGGDEFAVAWIHHDSVDALIAQGQDLADALARPFPHEDSALIISAAIGLTKSRWLSSTPQAARVRAGQMCIEADQAMYRSKAAVPLAPVLFDPDSDKPRLGVMEKEILLAALRKGEIRPHYQPKIALGTRMTVGYEALARWTTEGGEVRLPGEFIWQIDELGLQGEFAYAITKQVVAHVRNLLDIGLDPGRVAVNIPEMALATLSGRDDIDWLLAEFESVRQHIIFEVTENVFTTRSGEMILKTISYFAESGVRISLDDFGTGYASFQHLRELRFDELKIDSSFIADLGKDPMAEVILEGFLSIARGLSADVVAEGVETDLQARILTEKGCQTAQGFLFGAARPFEAIRAELMARQRRASSA